MKCRFCKSKLEKMFIDLGHAPPSNAYLLEADLTKVEKYYPLKVKVCEKCWLVQTIDTQTPEDYFNADYALFQEHPAHGGHMLEHLLMICAEPFHLMKTVLLLRLRQMTGTC